MFVPGDRRPKGSSSEAFLGKSGGIETYAKRELVDTQQQLIERILSSLPQQATSDLRTANHILIPYQLDHHGPPLLTLQLEMKLDVGSNGPAPLQLFEARNTSKFRSNCRFNLC